MNSLLLFGFALVLGFVSAIPPGGSQIEMAKRAISGRVFAAWLVIAGSVSTDIFYGAISLYGLAHFLEVKWVLRTFNILGAVLLCVLGYLTLKEANKPKKRLAKHWGKERDGWSFLTGLSVGLSNPSMLLSWLLGVTLAKHLGLAAPFPGSSKAIFIAGGAIGLGSYHAILAVILARLKRFISKVAMKRIQVGMGFSLFALSSFFIYQAVRGAV